MLGYWNNKLCLIKVVEIIVPAWDKEKDPILAWWRPFVGAKRQAIQVTTMNGQDRFTIDNECGDGLVKVTIGRGCPPYPHSSLPDRCEVLKEVPSDEIYRECDMNKKSSQDDAIELWYDENCPELKEERVRLARLKESIGKHKI